MPMRVGEMMVIVRAEDFASRTLRRVSTEFGRMSSMQMAQMRTAERLGTQRVELRRLNLLQRNIDMQNTLNRMEDRRLQLQARAVQQRTPSGRFLPLTPDIIEARKQLQKLDAIQSRLNLSQAAAQAEIGRLPRRYQAWSRSAGDVAEKLARVRGELPTLRNNLAQINKMIPIESMDNLGHAISGIGRTMQLFGAVGTAAFGLASRSAAQFSTDVSLAATQARNLEDSSGDLTPIMDKLQDGFRKGGKEIDGILDLMLRYPATADDMTAATYEIFSSMNLQRKGVTNVAKGLGLLESANKIAVAGGVDLVEATSAMITVLNNFDPQLKNTTENFDTMFDIVRFGRMRLSDFNVMMNKIAPAAAGANQSLEDVGGAMAFLTEVMPSQRMVATGISRLLEALQHPDVVKGLRLMGVEITKATGGLKPFDEIMQSIADRFPALTKKQLGVAEFFRMVTQRSRGAGRGLFFTQEGRRAFQQIITHMDQFIARQDQIEVNQKEFNRAFQAQLKTPGVQWAIFTNQLRALVLVIGREAIPVFVMLGEQLRVFLDWFRNLNPETRGFVVRIGAMVAVAALLGGVMASIFCSLLAFEAMLRRLIVGGAGAATMLGSVWLIARRLAAIGAILLILKAMWSGEASAVQFIMAAVLGGAIGFGLGGPAGAAVGAITVPVLLAIAADIKKTPMEKAFGEWEKQFTTGIEKFARTKFLGTNIPFSTLIPFELEHGRKEFEKQWNLLMESTKRGTKDAAERNRDTLNAMLKDVDPEIRRLFEKYIQIPEKQMSLQEKMNRAQKRFISSLRKGQLAAAQEQAAEMRRIYDEMVGGTDSVIEKQKQLADVTEQATKSAVDSLRNMYMQLEGENERFFGQLFEGPWLTSETFDLAKEWGIAPRIQDMIFDLKEQNQKFIQWRQSLDKVLKRGLPRDFVDELRQMGPEKGQHFLDQIIGARPEQVNRLIREWRQRQGQIKQATKMDFRDEIDRFKKAGGDMGDAIINGFQQAGVGAWFDRWIKQTFPEVINAAVAQAKADFQANNPAAPKPAPQPPGATPNNKAGVGAPPSSSTTTTTDRSRNQNVTINVQGEGARTATDEARMRHIAFIANQLWSGWKG